MKAAHFDDPVSDAVITPEQLARLREIARLPYPVVTELPWSPIDPLARFTVKKP